MAHQKGARPGIQKGAAGDSYTNIENLLGGNFNDTLFGNFAANVLTGGAGDDTLRGGGGDDVLAGGTGAGDVILFDYGAAAPNGFADVQAAAIQNGADTVITFGTSSVRLVNFNAADLAADDFIFS